MAHEDQTQLVGALGRVLHAMEQYQEDMQMALVVAGECVGLGYDKCHTDACVVSVQRPNRFFQC